METRNIDWINSVREQWDNVKDKNVLGYIINGTMSVPTSKGNTHYQDVLEWLKTNTPEPQYTEEEVTTKQKAQYLRDSKYIGKPYTDGGDNISFTKDDALGLLQVQAAFDLGLTGTIFEFSNGTKLPVKPYGFKKFCTWFVTERAKFFNE